MRASGRDVTGALGFAAWVPLGALPQAALTASVGRAAIGASRELGARRRIPAADYLIAAAAAERGFGVLHADKHFELLAEVLGFESVRLPERYATAVMELLPAIAADPRRLGKPLRFELEGLWAARRGPYRIIYAIGEEARVVTVPAVAHRADVYRPR